MHPSEADKLERFIADRGRPLLAAAKLLTGSQEAAEDLLQAALERLIRHWSRIEGDPEGYLRRTLYNLAADGWRRRKTRIAGLRRLDAAARSGGGVAGQTETVDLRDALVRQLLTLPPRQRAVLVLRYWPGPPPPARRSNHEGITMTDTEDLLRAAMARFTEDVRVPSGMPARAARHLRRRRAAVVASVIASLAAVTATAAALTGTGPGQDTQAQTAAYVLSRTEASLAAVSQRNFIQAIHQTLSGGRGSESVWWYGQHERLVSTGPAAVSPSTAETRWQGTRRPSPTSTTTIGLGTNGR